MKRNCDNLIVISLLGAASALHREEPHVAGIVVHKIA